MCVVSTVIDGWKGPGWPIFPQPHRGLPYQPDQPYTIPTGPNYIPWKTVEEKPELAAQMLEVLKKLEAIDRRLGQLEQCKVTAKEKKNLKAKLRRIANRQQL